MQSFRKNPALEKIVNLIQEEKAKDSSLLETFDFNTSLLNIAIAAFTYELIDLSDEGREKGRKIIESLFKQLLEHSMSLLDWEQEMKKEKEYHS